MKRFLLISLLLVLLLQIFGKLFIMADYQANKEYIMAFLCVNRDKPELQCEGKCHLKKELEKHGEAEKQSSERSQKYDTSINLFCQELFRLPAFPGAVILSPVSTYKAAPATQAHRAIFHPPQYLV